MEGSTDGIITRKNVIDNYPDLAESMIDILRDDAESLSDAVGAIRLNYDVLRRTFSEKDIKDVSDKLYNFHNAIQKYITHVIEG